MPTRFSQQFWRKVLNRCLLCQPLTRFYDRIQVLDRLGDLGEREAERFLLRQGAYIVARGYSDQFGEIDLVAVDGETIVFVEVKTRRGDEFGSAAEAVDETKEYRLTQTATGYLHYFRLMECRARFDVIAITWPEGGSPEIEHFKHAFEPVGDFQLF